MGFFIENGEMMIVCSETASSGSGETPQFSESCIVIYSVHFFFSEKNYTDFAFWLVRRQQRPTRDTGQAATAITLFLQMWENNEKSSLHMQTLSHHKIKQDSMASELKEGINTLCVVVPLAGKHEGTSIHVSPPGLTLLNYP